MTDSTANLTTSPTQATEGLAAKAPVASKTVIGDKPSGAAEKKRRLTFRQLETRRGVTGEALVGGKGPNLVYLHSAFGVTPDDRLLNKLAKRFTVHAPIWPGFGSGETETPFETMLDLTLHGWDLVDAMGLTKPIIVGNSMGAMIAAEMATTAPTDLAQLTLIAPGGLSAGDSPVPNILSMPRRELADILFSDRAEDDPETSSERLTERMVAQARRLGPAGRLLFASPDGSLANRLYRVAVSTTLVWGAADRFYPTPYQQRWKSLLPAASQVIIPDTGHMLTTERPSRTAKAVRKAYKQAR